MTITDTIGASFRAALNQVFPGGDPRSKTLGALSLAAARNASQALRNDAIPTLVEVGRALGAAEVSITFRPSGCYSVRLVCSSVSYAVDIAALLGMSTPTAVNNGERQWHVSEAGDWESGDYVCVLGPSKPLCGECAERGRAA